MLPAEAPSAGTGRRRRLLPGRNRPNSAPAGISPLAGLLMADSRDDPRVQVADLLAGMARRLPETAADGPLQPFVSPTSLRDPQPQ
jgi:hypothetical protein